MDPISSPDDHLSPTDRRQLLALVHQAIGYGLEYRQVLVPDSSQASQALSSHRACFVTLHLNKQLRGCVGTLQARQALLTEVAQSAYNAAFEDPRFAPVSSTEAPDLAAHISVLTKPQGLACPDESSLLAQLRPHVDGLILREGNRTATFLPSVWDSLPEPSLFLRQLKRKAGLADDHWSDALTVERYQTISFGDGDP